MRVSAIEVTPDDAAAMIGAAFDRMLARARLLGDRVCEQPALPGANSVSALIVHCIGVTRWWLAHEALGEPIGRDRDAEFESRLGVDELEAEVDALRLELPGLLARVAAAGRAASVKPDGASPAWRWTPPGMLLHVLEELFQHAGHADLTADILLARAD